MIVFCSAFKMLHQQILESIEPNRGKLQIGLIAKMYSSNCHDFNAETAWHACYRLCQKSNNKVQFNRSIVLSIQE